MEIMKMEIIVINDHIYLFRIFTNDSLTQFVSFHYSLIYYNLVFSNF